MGVSILPYSNVDLRYSRDITSENSAYENVFYQGSISNIKTSLAYAVNNRISIAASVSYYFGNIKDEYQLVFDDPDIYNSYTDINYKIYGPALSAGMRVRLLDSLYVGSFVDFKPNLTLGKVTFDPLTRLNVEEEQDISLPLSWGVGTSYFLSKRVVVAADYAFQNWSEGFDIAAASVKELDDWYHLGFGVERIHLNSRRAKGFDKFDWRAGMSMRQIGYLFNNESVTQKAVHFGIGFPFFNNSSRLDIGLMAGIRGDKSKTLAQEKFFLFNFSISAGELWFQKFR